VRWHRFLEPLRAKRPRVDTDVVRSLVQAPWLTVQGGDAIAGDVLDNPPKEA